jgi:hypothetical protein
LFDDNTANVNFSEYSYDQLMFENILESYSEVDGKWYLNNVYCHGGNSRLVEPVVEFVEITDPIRNPPDITALPVRALPAELDPDRATEPPSEERVIELWTEYISDTLLPISDFFPNKGDLHLCADGSVVSPTGMDDVDLLLDTPGSWRMSRSAAMSAATWWEATLGTKYVIREGRRDVFQSQLILKVENGEVVADYLTTTRSVPVYESEYCKNLGG